MLIRIGDVVCFWYEREKRIESGSISTIQYYAVWIPALKFFSQKSIQHRMHGYIQYIHVSIPTLVNIFYESTPYFYVYVIWKFRSWDVGLRGWIRKFEWKKYMYKTLDLFKCGFRSFLTMCGREKRELIPNTFLPEIYRFHQYQTQVLFSTENTKLNFMCKLISMWHFHVITLRCNDDSIPPKTPVRLFISFSFITIWIEYRQDMDWKKKNSTPNTTTHTTRC